jgi:hypothetical protein
VLIHNQVTNYNKMDVGIGDGASMMMVLVEINVGYLLIPSIILFFLQWCDGAVGEDLWQWHGGTTPSCQDVSDVVGYCWW